MDNKEREDARKTLAEITKTLEDETLTAEQRQELEIHAARLSGFLLSVWLPVDWFRRAIMIGIVALGAYGLMVENYEVFVWWLLLPFFSPRISGEIAFFWGRGFGNFKGRAE